MTFYKQFDNGLRVVIEKMEGLYSVSAGVMVKAGSSNETEQNNGISHFIEHCVFKGTKNRSAFEISDGIDRIGAQINAYTSKEVTCYYTKSTSEHLEECLDVLSDLFFNATFEKKELEKEKGVIIEEINMSIDTPEDYCLDLLDEAHYGKEGYGRTILGTVKNVKSFTKEDVLKYMDEYYTADNVVISIAGNVDENKAFDIIEKLFVSNFTRLKGVAQKSFKEKAPSHLYKCKKTEQTHVSFAFPAPKAMTIDADSIEMANLIFGGGMSSRLFQQIREEMGLAYSVYSYYSAHEDSGVIEIYAGVTNEKRNEATKAIISEIENFRKNGITEQEFIRAKEQIKSAFIMGRESTYSQMLLFGRCLIRQNKIFDFDERIKRIENQSVETVNKAIKKYFIKDKIATATLGIKRSPLKI